MVAAYVAHLERAISPARLAPYRPPEGDDLAMVTTYFWNIALCRELYPCLGAMEVTMRNAIHDALTVYFGNAAWYDMPNLLLRREHDQVVRSKREIANKGKPIIPGRVVASLSFGFWTSILDAAYGNSIWTARNPAVLVQQAFPYAPIHEQVRGRAHGRFNPLRTLRNRVFHYEPIWHWVDLLAKHADVIDAIGWVDPAVRASVAAFDRCPNGYQHGRVMIEWEIKQHLNLP